MELRQLRYFVTLAEELHFGHAAAREHIVQSALSQQIQRLERELHVTLVERTTHHVRLTPSGETFLAHARQILHRLDCAKAAAQAAAHTAPALRVALGDATCNTMPQVLQVLAAQHPGVEIHRVEVGLPEQCRQLIEGRLDIGFGRASCIPPEIDSELVRRDRMGVLVTDTHPLAGVKTVAVGYLAGVPMLFTDHAKAPELNEFITEMCRSAGFTPTVYPERVESVRAAAAVVAQGYCVACVPGSCQALTPGTVWVPLAKPTLGYPWSLLWRVDNTAPHVGAVLDCARALARTRNWMCCDFCLNGDEAITSCDHVS